MGVAKFIRQCYAFSTDIEVVSVSTCSVLLEEEKEKARSRKVLGMTK